jgi:hypothetical protein
MSRRLGSLGRWLGFWWFGMNTIDGCVFVFNCRPISRAGCHGRVLLVKSRGAFYSISTPLRKLRNRILNFPGISIDSNERHRHGCSLFPINVRFAKVAVKLRIPRPAVFLTHLEATNLRITARSNALIAFKF